jgi:hypothetical protein
MTYTRRTLLRNAASVSLAAAASSSIPFLTGCHHKPKTDPNCTGDDKAEFCAGMRLFFVGAWLFFKNPDPNVGGMLAITGETNEGDHTYPYGVWPGDGGFTPDTPQLYPNDPGTGSTKTPYPITIGPGFDSFQYVNDLFADAAQQCGLSYISSPKRDIKIDFTQPDIRMVSFPIPTRLITAGFTSSAYITSSDDNHRIHSPRNSSDSQTGPTASTHIFEYVGASSLNFNGKNEISSPSSSYEADFHFHTVPTKLALKGRPDGTGCNKPHQVCMFDHLMSLTSLGSGPGPCKVKLQLPHQDEIPCRGPHVPESVSSAELTIPIYPDESRLRTEDSNSAGQGAENFHGTTASCAHSISIGDGG